MSGAKINGIKIPTEVFSRVSGFYRPLNQWNPGKKSEYNDRKMANMELIKGGLYEEDNNNMSSSFPCR